MEQLTIVLPENLSERRSLLQTELNKVVEAQLEISLQDDLKGLLNEAGFTEGTASLEWEFYGEYDDEGGTDYYPSGVSLVVNGESIDMEEHTFMHKGYSDEPYETELYDYVHDVLSSHHSDLYDLYVTDVTVKLGEE